MAWSNRRAEPPEQVVEPHSGDPLLLRTPLLQRQIFVSFIPLFDGPLAS
jgi:hypothetical protein